MNGVWTSLDEENDYIRRSNVPNYNINIIVKKISDISKNAPLPNIEGICREKVYELDEEFKKQGMEIFAPHGNISRCIRNDLSNFTGEATKELGKITDALALTYPGFMTSSKIFTNKLYSILTKNYNGLCNRTQNYTIKDNLYRLIFEYYRDSRYWIFTPGSYIEAWEKQKSEIIDLGYESFITENEYKILKLIKMQEEKSKAFDLKQHDKGKQELTDEELANELDRLSAEKEKLETKYAEEEAMTR